MGCLGLSGMVEVKLSEPWSVGGHTLQYRAIQCSVWMYSAVQCRALKNMAIQCSRWLYTAVQGCAVKNMAIQCGTVPCSAVQGHAVPCSAVQYLVVQYTTLNHHTTKLFVTQPSLTSSKPSHLTGRCNTLIL